MALKLFKFQREILSVPIWDKDGHGTVITLLKSRRIGGSFVMALRALHLALGRALKANGEFVQAEPGKVVIVSKDFAGSCLLLRECADLAEELAPLDPSYRPKAVQATKIVMGNDEEIVALPCSQAAIRGIGAHVLIDELCHIPRIEDIYGAAKIVAGASPAAPRGFSVMMCSTAWDAGSLSHRLLVSPEYDFIRFRVDVNDAKQQGHPIDIEKAKAEIGIDEIWRCEFLCEFLHGGSSFFGAEKLRICSKDKLPDGWEYAPARFGIDCGLGKGRDFTAVVQWRFVEGAWWMVGLKASNSTPTVEMADTVAEWILEIPGHIRADIKVDQGVMGADFIAWLSKRLKERRNTDIIGVNMGPIDQERYAVAGRRLLERKQLQIYTGTDAGGDPDGARALTLELGQLKTRPGNGGRLTFVTPRDASRGHCDRAWASLIGLDEADEDAPVVVKPPPVNSHSAPRFGHWGGSRGFG